MRLNIAAGLLSCVNILRAMVVLPFGSDYIHKSALLTTQILFARVKRICYRFLGVKKGDDTMQKVLIGLILAFLVISARAQTCDQMIDDQANVLGSKTADIESAGAQILTNGGDVRVVTIRSLSKPMDLYIQEIRRSCLSWQSGNGGWKNNLIVFALAPQDRKMGIYFGPQWANILAGSDATIKSQFMAPAFRDHDWSRGIVAGEKQVANRLIAFNEAALHPVQHTEIHQATDLRGLWMVCYVFLGAVFILLLAIFVLHIIRNRRKTKETTLAAQREAQRLASLVASKLNALSDTLAEKIALGENKSYEKRMLSQVSEDYAREAGSEDFNGSSPSRSIMEYQSLAKSFQRFLDRLSEIEIAIDHPKGMFGVEKGKQTAKAKVSSHKSKGYVSPVFTEKESIHSTPSPTNSVTHNYSTTYVDNSPTFIPIPIVEEERTVYVEPERSSPRDTSYSSSSDRSSYDNGSSSSWSDSSSSSSWDSGSSSDFGSSSSDFSGGSSSDF